LVDAQVVLGQFLFLLEIFSTPNFPTGFIGQMCLFLWARSGVARTVIRRVVALLVVLILRNNLPDVMLFLHVLA